MTFQHRRRTFTDLGHSIRDRILEYALRGTLLWGRVSSPRQARDSENSKQMQEQDGWHLVEMLGIPHQTVLPLFAFGESGRASDTAKYYSQVLQAIRDDQIGLIVVSEHHRMSRSLLRAAELFALCARKGVVFYVAGELRDPSSSNDRYFLQMLANTAEWQTSSSVEWNASAAFVAAQELRFRQQCPSGLCWASPDDQNYRLRMADAGLSDWLDARRLKTYLSKSSLEGRTYYILPFPDEKTFHSMQLRFAWLMETRSVHAVRARIMDGAAWGWPHQCAGKVPELRVTRWLPDHVAVWQPAQSTQLRRWFRNPLLYGIYSYYAVSQEPPAVGARRDGRTKGVHYPRALQLLQPLLPDAGDLLGLARSVRLATGEQVALPMAPPGNDR